MELAMMRDAEGHREFIAYLAAECARLGKLNVMRLRRLPPTNYARLKRNEFQVRLVQRQRLWNRLR